MHENNNSTETLESLVSDFPHLSSKALNLAPYLTPEEEHSAFTVKYKNKGEIFLVTSKNVLYTTTNESGLTEVKTLAFGQIAKVVSASNQTKNELAIFTTDKTIEYFYCNENNLQIIKTLIEEKISNLPLRALYSKKQSSAQPISTHNKATEENDFLTRWENRLERFLKTKYGKIYLAGYGIFLTAYFLIFWQVAEWNFLPSIISAHFIAIFWPVGWLVSPIVKDLNSNDNQGHVKKKESSLNVTIKQGSVTCNTEYALKKQSDLLARNIYDFYPGCLTTQVDIDGTIMEISMGIRGVRSNNNGRMYWVFSESLRR